MRTLKTLVACLLVCLPLDSQAGIDASGLPATATWYFHVDFEQMRDSKAGRSLYDWLEAEVFEDVRREARIDLAKEADRITAYSSADSGVVAVVDGRIGQGLRDKWLAIASTAEEFKTLESGGKTYYHVTGEDNFHGNKVDLDGDLYFSFAVSGKALLTTKKEQMETLLANKGRNSGRKGPAGALIVLTAERSLVQAGMDTGSVDTDEGGFESNILRNTKQAALMIADAADTLSIEAVLVASEAKTARSLASIVRGLIALQALDDDMEPGIAEVLQSAQVELNDAELKFRVAISAETLTAALD